MDISQQIKQMKEQLAVLEKSMQSIQPSVIISNPNMAYANYVHPRTGQYVIIRSYGSGCHFGILKSFDPYTCVALLNSARRLWYWDKAFTLSEVAVRGIGGDSKLPVELEEITVCNVNEIIPATDAAISSIKNWKEYRAHD